MLDDSLQNIVVFQDKGKASAFKSKRKQGIRIDWIIFFAYIPVFCIFDTANGKNLIRADVLGHSWLDDILQRNMPEVWSTSNTKLPLSGSTIVHLRNGESCTLGTFNVMEKLVVSVL